MDTAASKILAELGAVGKHRDFVNLSLPQPRGQGRELSCYGH